MPTIIVTTFELADSVTAESFATADERYQQDVAYQLPGLLRRTTARAADGQWCVIETWSDATAATAWHESELGSSVLNANRSVYETLD